MCFSPIADIVVFMNSTERKVPTAFNHMPNYMDPRVLNAVQASEYIGWFCEVTWQDDDRWAHVDGTVMSVEDGRMSIEAYEYGSFEVELRMVSDVTPLVCEFTPE